MSGEITNKNEWKAQELWMIGVDTPDGIKCCLGACTAGELVMDCPCEDNAEVREATRARLETIKGKLFIPREEELFLKGLSILRYSRPDLLREVIEAIRVEIEGEVVESTSAPKSRSETIPSRSRSPAR